MTVAEVVPRWFRLLDHAEQSRMHHSPARHRLLAAGRGSGKTENAIRTILGGDPHHRGAFAPPSNVYDPLFVVAAPTREQVKRIWWDKLKQMVPREMLSRAPLETELTLVFRNRARVMLLGLDKPHRVEGITIDGLVVDEFAEVKSDAWGSSLEPACNRLGRPGWALFIGRPKGRNHFYDLWRSAKTRNNWDSFHWTSEPVIGAAAMEELRDGSDPLTFRQEWLADWVNFGGLAYYQWDPNLHMRKLRYRPELDLFFCFDFNREPGVAAIVQEQDFPQQVAACACGRVAKLKTGDVCPACKIRIPPVVCTAVIAEVWIPRNSNTPAVCNKLAKDWGHHQGRVLIYGDATGGRVQSSQERSASDWDLVRDYLRPTFGDRLSMRVASVNPHQRDRINAVNTRLRSSSGMVRLMVDPEKAPHVVKDFEGIQLLEGGSGEVDKKRAERDGMGHLLDALGYLVEARYRRGSGLQVASKG